MYYLKIQWGLWHQLQTSVSPEWQDKGSQVSPDTSETLQTNSHLFEARTLTRKVLHAEPQKVIDSIAICITFLQKYNQYCNMNVFVLALLRILCSVAFRFVCFKFFLGRFVLYPWLFYECFDSCHIIIVFLLNCNYSQGY